MPEIKNDQYVKYNDFPVHINKKAHKLWVAKVTGYDDDSKYPVQLDWLDKEWFDGVLYYDIEPLVAGDMIKVNAGSHRNRYPTYFQVKAITDDELKLEEMKELDVIDELDDDQNLKQEVLNAVNEVEDEEVLKQILEVVNNEN